jgi:AraC family transcriptional regulator of adaptative response / DNA-3-methyladenine glycosylase II
MLLEFDSCYRALMSRDPRFDGRFFTGVVTTGVYCRPVCPAPTPLARNVRFFACAAAAERAGFRPCRRCRPEASPGTPAWLGSSATLSRGLRLIAEGALNGDGVEEVARRLGLGTRHLRRLFAQHLGASPVAVVQTQRVHFARKLIDETRLPMTRVAFSSGFTSVRQFNHAIRKAFGRTPRELRRTVRQKDRPPAGGDLVLRLPYRPPFDWAAVSEFLAGRAIPGVEAVDAGCYRRTVALGGVGGVLEVRPAEGQACLLLTLRFPVAQALMPVVERVRRLFDLGADPLPITEQLRADPRLRAAVEARPGMRVPGAWDGFELAVRAILGQQVSVRAATTLAGRLAHRFGQPHAGGEVGGLTHFFPTPEVLARADLAGLGILAGRARAIRGLAAALCSGELSFDASAGLDEVAGRLTRIPGIGPWTAQYIAMRALREPDAFPASDLGLRRALAPGKKPLTASELSQLAERWRPWRAYAAIYLWTSPVPNPPKSRNRDGDPRV